jgi:hypothetical protein
MIDLIIETTLFILVLFFLLPGMLIFAVLLHAVTDRKHKHGLWNQEDAAAKY